MTKYKIFVNKNNKVPYGTALAVVAALNKEHAHGLLLMLSEFIDEYYDFLDWKDTGIYIECDKPHVIAETHYQE